MAHDVSFRAASRHNTGWLTYAERRVLTWLAAELPEAVNSDHLTGLGFLAMVMVGASYALSSRWPIMLWWVVFWLAVNWFGDSLDGSLARARGVERPRYGFYVDHMCDSFGALFVLGGLAVSGRMTPIVAAAVLIGYFLLSIEIYLATYCVGRFEMSFWRLGPTELRILLAAGTLMLFLKPVVTIAGHPLALFDAAGIIAAPGLAATAIMTAARHTRQLYTEEQAGLVRRPAVQLLDDLPDDTLCVAEEH